jgi:hypothetical protein
MTLTKLITDVQSLLPVNCDYCGHAYVAHELEKNKNRKNYLFDVGRCLILGCNCASYVDKMEKIDEELL